LLINGKMSIWRFIDDAPLFAAGCEKEGTCRKKKWGKNSSFQSGHPAFAFPLGTLAAPDLLIPLEARNLADFRPSAAAVVAYNFAPNVLTFGPATADT
jgi:hypothetical protein